MGDDLDSFFARKKAKAGKKKLIQDVQTLAEKLEQTVKEQEELDKLEGEEQEKNKPQEQIQYQQPTSPDDSEWIEYSEQAEVDVNKLNIKDFDATDPDPGASEEEEVIVGQRRTWNVDKGDENSAKKDSDDEEDDDDNNNKDKPVVAPSGENSELASAPGKESSSDSLLGGGDKASSAVVNTSAQPEAAPVEPAVYRPPQHRTTTGSDRRAAPAWKTVAPNLTDAMQFPSLADADTLSAEAEAEAERKRKLELQAVSDRGVSGGRDTEKGSWSRARKFEIGQAAAGDDSRGGPAPPSEPAPPVNPNAYVPPARRRQATVVTAPQPQTTTQNRWANLNDVDSKQ